jgi:hypothetical protein
LQATDASRNTASAVPAATLEFVISDAPWLASLSQVPNTGGPRLRIGSLQEA